MIKKFLTIVAIAGLFASCGGEQQTEENQTETTVETEKTTTEIALGEFDTKAGEFVDQEILVTGIVDHVCKHGGKKILLVNDDGDVHVESETRFNDSIAGSEIIVTGIVREERIDESYLLQMEEDNIKSHSEGETNDDLFNRKKEHIATYRDSMKTTGVDHFSNYSLEYVSHKETDTKPEN
ncbi:MAG: hypothetical protein B6I20_02365 [Bacteroidetes bacterium 4572_117]|nr:MAG: hypothetical protein B6I20_02365 [Bacteroidetes bacterium 4572_117]